MIRAAVRFGFILAFLVMLANAYTAAQTPAPPLEPSDFSASFAGFDYYALPFSTAQGPVSLDGLGFNNFGFWTPGIPGTITGDWYEDYTNKRERFDVSSTDPHSTTPIATLWKFYDRDKIYLYHPATGKCTNSSLETTLDPFFGDFSSSTDEGQTGSDETAWYGYAIEASLIDLPGTVWTYQISRGNSLELAVDGSRNQIPLYITRYAPGRITRLQFLAFTSGQPDAAAFNLPAACVIP